MSELIAARELEHADGSFCREADRVTVRADPRAERTICGVVASALHGSCCVAR